MLGISQAPAHAENQNEEVKMDVTQVGSALALAEALAQDVEGLKATVTSLTALVESKDAQIAELNAVVAAAVEFKAAQEKAAAEAKAAARNAALTEVVGTEQAASLLAATAAMDDVAFGAVVDALNFKSKAEASSAAFTEVGAEGATDQAKLDAEVAGGKTADYLQAIVNKEIN